MDQNTLYQDIAQRTDGDEGTFLQFKGNLVRRIEGDGLFKALSGSRDVAIEQLAVAQHAVERRQPVGRAVADHAVI